jgi:hypothetical protein
LLHALLDLSTVTELQGHPIAGASWDGFVAQQIAALAPLGSQIGFYRTASGAQIDAVLTTGLRRIGFEIKSSAAPKPAQGFWQAKQDLIGQRLCRRASAHARPAGGGCGGFAGAGAAGSDDHAGCKNSAVGRAALT